MDNRPANEGNHKYSVVCLIARQCGVNLLVRLLQSSRVSVIGVFTHSKKPRSEDPRQGQRPEYSQICKLLEGRNIPLHVVDEPSEAHRMNGFEKLGKFDFLISLSWRFLVRPHFLGQSRMANINLHRGLLPQYRGAEPVRRMLEDGRDQATITAHIMVEAVDAGEILWEDHIAMTTLLEETIFDATERIKKALEPIYPNTAVKAMNVILQREHLPLISLEGAKT